MIFLSAFEPHKTESYQLLNLMKLSQHVKNQPNSSNHSYDIAVLKILLPNWPIGFRPSTQEAEFSWIWDLISETNNNMNFHLKLNSAKN